MKKKKYSLKKNIVCFVGISGKPGDAGTLEALSNKTLSGKIVSRIELKLRSVPECSDIFRDNLVKDPPLTNGKLRYPTSVLRFAATVTAPKLFAPHLSAPATGSPANGAFPSSANWM